jgi:hypothetical protein
VANTLDVCMVGDDLGALEINIKVHRCTLAHVTVDGGLGISIMTTHTAFQLGLELQTTHRVMQLANGQNSLPAGALVGLPTMIGGA